jgi:hypothetical protein
MRSYDNRALGFAQAFSFFILSRDVAKLFGIQRESLHKLIENHTAQLEQLGHVRFEIGGGKIRPQGGGTPEPTASIAVSGFEKSWVCIDLDARWLSFFR